MNDMSIISKMSSEIPLQRTLAFERVLIDDGAIMSLREQLCNLKAGREEKLLIIRANIAQFYTQTPVYQRVLA